MGWVAAAALNRIHRDVITASVEALDPRPGAAVADIGFGGGLGLELLLAQVGERGVVHGVEITDLTIRRARRQFGDATRTGRLHLHKAEIADLPMTSGSIDGVMTVNTIHHFDDLAAAFRAVARVLAPGGRCVVAFPDPERQRQMPMAATYGHRLRPVIEVEQELGAAGLHLTDVQRTYADVYVLLLAEKPG
jgi:arsenite methyltransferase